MDVTRDFFHFNLLAKLVLLLPQVLLLIWPLLRRFLADAILAQGCSEVPETGHLLWLLAVPKFALMSSVLFLLILLFSLLTSILQVEELKNKQTSKQTNFQSRIFVALSPLSCPLLSLIHI